MTRRLLFLLFSSAGLIQGCSCDGGGLAGLAPNIQATPASIHFDTVPLGERAHQALRIDNIGTAVLRVSSVEIEGVGLSLSALPTLPKTYAPSDGDGFTVDFEASSLEASSGAVTIHSDDPDAPALVVPIEATRRRGPVLVLCAESDEIPLERRCGANVEFPFGAVRPGEFRDAELELRSEGSDPVHVESIALSGGNTAAFSLSGTTASSLNPGEKSRYRVRFSPAAEGSYASSIVVHSDDGVRTSTLSGTSAPGALCIVPTSIDFGTVSPGAHADKTATIKNCGQSTLSLNSLEILRGPNVRFTSTVALPISLAPSAGLNVQVDLRWTPTSTSERLEGRLRAGSDQGSAIVSLLGTSGAGCALEAVPSILTFFGPPGVAELTVLNVGAQTCHIIRAEVTEGAQAFEVQAGFGLPVDLGAGSTLSLTVIDKAPPGAPARGALEVATADQTLQVPLQSSTANGQCLLAIQESTMNFGDVRPGSERVLAAGFSASGPDCHLTRLEIEGDSAFTVEPVGTATLADGTIGTLRVHFRPTMAGNATAKLHVESNSVSIPAVDIDLSGYGGRASLCVEPRNIDFGEAATEASAAVQLIGCGDHAVTVNAIDWSLPDAEIDLSSGLNLPLTIPQGTTQTIRVRYRPADADPDTATLRIASDDVIRPELRVRVTGGPAIVPPEAGRFLYYWWIGDIGSEVRRMPLQGSRTVETFWGPGNNHQCSGCHSLSPDGHYVALIEFGGGSSNVRIIDTVTNQARPNAVVQDTAFYFSWNPNVATDPPYQYVYPKQGDLWVASLETGDLGVVVGADSPNYLETMPSWGSDGRIYFARFPATENPGGPTIGVSGKGELMVVSAGGGGATPLFPNPDAISRYYPSISRDARWLAYTASNQDQSTISATDARIELVAVDGSGTREALPALNAGASSYPVWSLDGRYLSFSSNRPGGAGSWDVYFAPLSTRTGTAGAALPVPGLNTASFEHAAQWSP
ncbi:MAG: choice-of-anchor D domain-containing protein [Myxococcota bacterium]